MAGEPMISIPQVEYTKLLAIKAALDDGECRNVAQFRGRVDGSPIKDSEFFIPNLESFEAGDRVVIIKVKALP